VTDINVEDGSDENDDPDDREDDAQVEEEDPDLARLRSLGGD
jgi:hypothetical protein